MCIHASAHFFCARFGAITRDKKSCIDFNSILTNALHGDGKKCINAPEGGDTRLPRIGQQGKFSS
jgi:hypothetical protein